MFDLKKILEPARRLKPSLAALAPHAGRAGLFLAAAAIVAGMGVYNERREGLSVRRVKVEKPFAAALIPRAWVSESYKDEEIAALAARLKADGIASAIVDVGDLNELGIVDARLCSGAERFLGIFKKESPDIALLARIGVAAGENGGVPDIENLETLERIEREAGYMTGPLGFDGVQLEIPAPREKLHSYLGLLNAIKEALGEKNLSVEVATDVIPAPFSRLFGEATTPDDVRGRPGALRETAKIVDQATLTAAAPPKVRGWIYSAALERKTKRLMKAVAPAGLLVCVPDSPDAGGSGQLGGSAMRFAANGVARAVRGKRADGNFRGIALAVADGPAAAESPLWADFRKMWPVQARPKTDEPVKEARLSSGF